MDDLAQVQMLRFDVRWYRILLRLATAATTCVHDLVERLICQKCKPAGKRPAATVRQFAPRPRYNRPLTRAPENRCLVPFNSFAEYGPVPNPET
jgi:putative SOS response-associated peptidase YedK